MFKNEQPFTVPAFDSRQNILPSNHLRDDALVLQDGHPPATVLRRQSQRKVAGTERKKVIAHRATLTALIVSFSVVVASHGRCQGPQKAAAPIQQSLPLSDAAALSVTGGNAEAVEYLGRNAVRLNGYTESDIFAYVESSSLQDGTVDVDVAVKITTPPGVRMPGFTGLAFHSRPDGSHYDMFYIRPRNALSDDQAMRNHSVQYVAKPGYDWYPLRRQWPWVYESWADLKPESWTHLKIELHGRSARLFVNGSDSPSLVVNGLKGEELKGGIRAVGLSRRRILFLQSPHHSLETTSDPKRK